MSFQPFQNFIKRAANHYGIGKEMEAAKICQDFRKMMPELLKGIPQADQFIQPASYKNKTLVLNVFNPAWAQEIIIRRPKIIAEMNQKAGKEIIKNLYTQLSSMGHNQY